MSTRTYAFAAIVSLAVVTAGCQEVEQPSPTLTEKQYNEVKKHIYNPKKDKESEKPDPEYKFGANYDDKIELVGFSVGDPNKKEDIVAGESVTFRWYWKALSDIDKNWEIFIHFDSKDSSVDPADRRQNLDHQPLEGLYPTSKWTKGNTIEDVQTVRIRPNYPAGEAVAYIGLYRGKTRLPIKNEVPKTNDRRAQLPSLSVVNPSASSGGSDKGADKPRYAVSSVDAKTAESIAIDGKLDEDAWSNVEALELSPFGGGSKLASKVKVFRTDKHLYLSGHLEDGHVWSTKEERDANTWEEEVLELFADVDGDGKNYLELQINPKGTIFDANFANRLGEGQRSRRDQIDRAKKFNLEGVESAVHVDGTLNDDEDEDKFWNVEMKIPLTSLPGVDDPAKLGDNWAVNLYRYDRPTDQKTHTYGWSTKPRGDFHQVDKFGVFQFDGASGDGDSGSGKKGDPEVLKKKVPPEVQKRLEKKMKQNSGLPSGVDKKELKKKLQQNKESGNNN
ncbi:MAG: carbohydrate-binding family 9-like protein [Bradymonadaceae bacterium]